MRVSNVCVYGIDESAVASGYPMSATTEDVMYALEPDFNRLDKLSMSKPISGHSCALKGIIVQYDISCNHVMIPQFFRYHFHDVISSQSKMHRITQINLKESCGKRVDPRIIEICQTYIDAYVRAYSMDKDDPNKPSKEQLMEMYETIMENLPMGLELTMRMTSNYLQLQSIYIQRHNHKMSFWREYCDWIKTLPHSHWITQSKIGE